MRATNAKMTDFAAFSGRCIEVLRLTTRLRKSMLFSIFRPWERKKPAGHRGPTGFVARPSSVTAYRQCGRSAGCPQPGWRTGPKVPRHATRLLALAGTALSANLVAFDRSGAVMHGEWAM